MLQGTDISEFRADGSKCTADRSNTWRIVQMYGGQPGRDYPLFHYRTGSMMEKSEPCPGTETTFI